MLKEQYLPEGALIHTEQNRKAKSSITALWYAMENRITLEGRVILCDAAHNLVVELGEFTGMIPRREAAIGIDEGAVRVIAVISRVGKPVAFKITAIYTDENGEVSIFLSRKEAQMEALSFFLHNLRPGDVIPARVTHLEPFGAFVDIGCGNISLIGIENVSVSRISHPKDRFVIGQEIRAAVLHSSEDDGRITLTHRELLGTWEENAARFEAGQTVRGIVRGIEQYGVFVELAPNLSGLAERREDLSEGDHVSVFIKNIAPDKMKIKLIIIDILKNDEQQPVQLSDYFITDGHIDVWQYSPEDCEKKNIRTVFDEAL